MNMQADSTTYTSGTRQTAVNVLSMLASYAVTFGIAAVLTPFIVGKLGVAAYGFIGLSLNIISYTALLTVAVNSMATRFVSVAYHAGDIAEANRYISSTFYANTALSTFILIVFGIGTVFLEKMLVIPAYLLTDVKILFVLLFTNSCINLLTGVTGFPTFITNRLDISNARGAIGEVIRGVMLLTLYTLFPARLWYIGATALAVSLYSLIINLYWFRRLTPGLAVKRRHYSFGSVLRIVRSGAWNILTNLSDILNQGLELLLANIFIGPAATGILAVSKTIPTTLLGLFWTLSSSFTPAMTRHYARGDMKAVADTCLRCVRFLSCLCIIPCSMVFAYGDIIYRCWMPTQDSGLLYSLTIVAMTSICLAMPYEGLWQIFTVTDKVRKSSLNMLAYATATFAGVLVAVTLLDSPVAQLMAIVTIRSAVGAIRTLTLPPLYSAKILGLPRNTFYRPLIPMLTSTLALTAVSLLFRHLCMNGSGWGPLAAGICLTTLAGAGIILLQIPAKVFSTVFFKRRSKV